eukprot:scaffold368_cov137-Skeletonema_marinoi.AAC.5
MADSAMRQKRLQRNRARANSQRVIAAPVSQQQKKPQLSSPGSMPPVDAGVRSSSRASSAVQNNAKTTQKASHSSSSYNSSSGKVRHTNSTIPSSLPGEPGAEVSNSSAEQKYFNKHNQIPSSRPSGGRATPTQSRNDSDSWFQYTNGTNMRSSATPKVSKKVTTKIDNPQKRQQQQKPVSNNTNTASDFDSAWASFSDSPFDNSFSSGDPFASGGAVEWPTDDDDGIDVKKLNTTNKMRGKNRAEVKSVNVAAPATTKPKKNGIKAARTTTSQNITRPTKETKVKNDDEVEFWGVESDEVTNLTNLNNDWGEKQSDKEADIAALVKYRSGGKGEKATTGSSSRKVTNSVNSAVTQKQVSSSKATTATSSQALGNTAKLKSFFMENN